MPTRPKKVIVLGKIHKREIDKHHAENTWSKPIKKVAEANMGYVRTESHNLCRVSLSLDNRENSSQGKVFEKFQAPSQLLRHLG